MENIAHTLAGLVLVRAGLGRKTRFAASALVVGSNLPDIDALALLSGRIAYIHAHRGITHSLAGGAVLGIGFGAALYALGRVRDRRHGTGGSRAAHASPETGPRSAASAPVATPSLNLSLWALIGLSLLAVMGHIAFDALNDYGIRLFLPFSDRWWYGDTIFVADPWFWLLLGGGLHLALPYSRARETLAWAGWGALSVPVLAHPAVEVPARVVWLVGLGALAAARGLGWLRAVHHGGTPEHGAEGRSGRWQRAAIGSHHAAPGEQAGARRWSLRGAAPRAALAALATYVIAAAGLHQLATRTAGESTAAGRGSGEIRRVSVLPKPADPLHWNLLFERGREIVTGSVPVWPVGATASWRRVYETQLDREEVHRALATPTGRAAREFCRYLFADVHTELTGTIVALRDARFAIRGRDEFSIFLVPVPRPGEPGEAAPGRVDSPLIGETPPPAPARRGPA